MPHPIGDNGLITTLPIGAKPLLKPIICKAFINFTDLTHQVMAACCLFGVKPLSELMIRVRSTLKSAWILTLVLKSAWIWYEPWKLHKILEKCLNYSIPSLIFFLATRSMKSVILYSALSFYMHEWQLLCAFLLNLFSSVFRSIW